MIDAFVEAARAFGFPATLVATAAEAMREVEPAWRRRDAQAMRVSTRLLRAFADAGISDAHLQETTGYGYHDFGREAYESILARALGAEAAFARPQLTTGTQAIVATIQALAGEGAVLSITGRPYDTLRMALVDHPRAPLRSPGRYAEAAWPHAADDDGRETLVRALQQRPAIAFLQRSRGYASRPSATIADIASLVEIVRRTSPATHVVVDNCYGEFVEPSEPCDVGADVVVGSLIKNPGGGIAPTGAYVAGRAALVERVAERIFAPGLGAGVGPNLGTLRWLFAGLHRAPQAVAQSLKILDFAAALFARLGFDVDPPAGAPRTDIIQAIRLGSPDLLVRFSEGLQRLLPVNARAKPIPGPVPGYADPVIMAGGAFVTGSTIELSCDAPLRAPYEVYLQGGLDAAHGALAVTSAAAATVA